VEWREDFGLKLERGVPKREGHLKGIHVRDRGDELLGAGVSGAPFGGGVFAAPGLAFEGDSFALQAGGENLSTESDVAAGHGHAPLSSNRKARTKRALGYYFYFIELTEIVGQISFD